MSGRSSSGTERSCSWVLRQARYVDETETVEFGEIHVFVGPNFVITIRHGEASELGRLSTTTQVSTGSVEEGPDGLSSTRLSTGSSTTIDPSSKGWRTTSTRSSLKSSAGARNVSANVRADPRGDRVQTGRSPAVGHSRTPHSATTTSVTRRSAIYATSTTTRFEFKSKSTPSTSCFASILSVNLTLGTKALSEAGNKQNEEVKKISAWAAILFAPTIVGTVYGMNFEHMPKLELGPRLSHGARVDAFRFGGACTPSSATPWI